LNPDLAISTGAAIQGSVISGQNTDILLLDVTSLNFYLETLGGVATCMIENNSTIPCSKSQIFSTSSDNQPGVELRIATGERPLFKDNKFLGSFNLDVMPARRGVPQISVDFSIDSNSILTVKAIDKGTGKENKIRIEGSSALTKEEIERMKMEAKANEENDKKEKEKIDKLNQADSIIFQTEKQIKDFGDKLTENDKNNLNESVEKLKTAYKSQDLNDIDSYSKELNEKWNIISTEIYKKTSSEQQGPKAKDAEPVEDVEFQEV
jgi:molecular chaperone DnaK